VPVLEVPHQRAERAVRDTLGEVAAFAKLGINSRAQLTQLMRGSD